MAKQPHYTTVDAMPVKSFFVSMLTRDIKLEDAILDLLDNSVDGILRSKQHSGKKPYKGFYAEIEFKDSTFSISDNCGGIPWDQHKYAFRMGRSNDRKDVAGTVGAYGIGMKRAIFKMGQQCLISTQNGDNSYEVEITPKWIKSGDWEIPVRAAKKEREEDGTTIVIGDLYKGIYDRFNAGAKIFSVELINLISTHYAFIIDKGLTVKVNGIEVLARPTKIVFDQSKKGIKPFLYKTVKDGVEVFLAIGLTRPIPSQDEANSDQEEKQYSTLDAGWTILCNDRAVLYCDRSELTGWGEAGVARYHTQFIAIAGVVEFRSLKDASKLPTTTTKRGIDASSILYLQVKNKMREGMQLFIDYTNKWKGQADESKRHVEDVEPVTLTEIKNRAVGVAFKSSSQPALPGQQYKPVLPMPEKIESKKRRISYIKNIKDIERVGDYLFQDKDSHVNLVGEKCFDIVLAEAKQ